MKLALIGIVLFLLTGGAHAKESSATPEKIQKLVQQFDAVQTFKYIMAGNADPRPLPPENPDNPNPPDEPSYPPPNNPPNRPRPPNCDPDWGDGGSPGSCIEAVCNHLSYFECNNRERLMEITRMCRNVRGSCVKAVCSRVGSFECDDRNELGTVTQICRGMYDTGCIDYVCSRLPRWDCDELIEIRKIADQCR
ncbi:hypothetical protein [Bdellovibrio sp. HCB2-146]|uniref:hypothetical protein n=1 Tax=Bdellovibrio sp. HCB2-146 TaxID=3394362 RepID=UPI0039BD6096